MKHKSNVIPMHASHATYEREARLRVSRGSQRRRIASRDAATPLEAADIVFLGHQRWNTHVTAVQNSVVRLARTHRVLFVEPPDSMAWLPTEPAAREALTWILDPLERKDDNLYIYHTPPLFLPGQARARWIARAVDATFQTMLRLACHRLGFRRPLFWIYQFNTVGVVKALRPRCTVYECAEEWEEYETDPVVKRYIHEMDAELCRTADVVIVPSQAMYEKKHVHNASTYLVPWGVDLDLYGRTRRAETPIPDDVAGLAHPIIGMFGMLDGRRLHTRMLAELARRHPEWNIVLVGRCMPNLDRSPLEALPNVHFLGMKPVEAIPGYCKAFDVCMIPYMLNDFTRSIMPLKIAEYLATGKPVVSTPLPAATELRDVIRIGADADIWARHIVEALNEPEDATRKRIERADQYDWDLLIQRRMKAVARHMGTSGAGHDACRA